MSEMKPLLDGSLPPDLAEMLHSADLDEPIDLDDRERRLLAVLAAAPAALDAKPSLPSSHRLVSLAKWGVPVLLVVAGSAAILSTRSSPSGPRSAEPRPTPAPVAAESAAPLTVVETPSTAVRVEDLPSAPSPTARREMVVVNDAPPVPAPAAQAPKASIADELAAIDAARSALAAGRAADALSQTQGYRSTFPTPHFSDEADALEIQSLAALGRTADARAKGTSFLANHPSSPYVQRVRVAAGLPSP